MRLEEGEEVRRRGSGSGSPSASYFAGDACRHAEVQQEIATSSKHLRRRSKKGEGTGHPGLFITSFNLVEGARVARID
jgi:hypothetical protein